MELKDILLKNTIGIFVVVKNNQMCEKVFASSWDSSFYSSNGTVYLKYKNKYIKWLVFTVLASSKSQAYTGLVLHLYRVVKSTR